MSISVNPGYATSTGVLGRWAALILGASIPASVALDNVLLAIVLALWLVGLHYREKISLAWRNPVYRAALLLFGALLAGTFYGDSAPGDARLYLTKYLDLALIPVLGWAFITMRSRAMALRILAGMLGVTLLLSFLLKAGITPQKFWMYGTPDFPIVFKSRLTHNILMALAAYLFFWLAWDAGSRIARFFWATLSVFAVINVTLMVEGATGYVLLATLALLLGWQFARWRGLSAAIAAGLMAVILLSTIPGPFQSRVKQIISELKQAHIAHPASTSTGYRLEFYRNTLTLVVKNPVFGTGTGSFPMVYADLVRGTGQTLSRNPHNEFLLIATQTGLIGLAALLWLLWQQWRLAPQLPTQLEIKLAQGLVVTMVVVCMFNSALLDHTEGLLYAWLTAVLYAGLKSGDSVTGN